jgi:tetratricopeptide (TPR) repeat protein
MQAYPVAGLTGAEGAELLQKQGVKATEAELNTAVTRCAGHAFSLTLLASLLHMHKLRLDTLLGGPAYTRLWTGDIARNFLDAIYSQLNDVQRKVLFAFSIYREPVPSEAARAVIADSSEISQSQVASALHALLVQHLLQAAGGGLYQLHAIVATYIQEHIVEDGESSGQVALKAAHAEAAQYYLRQAAIRCPPRQQRRQSSDVHDLIEAIWQYSQAEQWQEAYDLMRREWIFPQLNLWGNNATLLELYTLFLPSQKWQPEDAQAALIYNNLGLALRDLGQMRQAQGYFEKALRLRRQIDDRKGEGASLNHLGRVYADLGEKERAKEYLEQALQIRREVKDRQGETTTLNNLGHVYADLGEKERAKEYLEQALSIAEKEESARMKSTTLTNLGQVCADSGETERAREYLERSLDIRREIGYRAGEGKTLRILGSVYEVLGQIKQAQQCYQDSLNVFRGLGDREEEATTLYEMGLLSFEQEDYDTALACFLIARKYLEEVQSSKQREVERHIDILRAKIGEKRFDALLARVKPTMLRIIAQEAHREK